MSRAEGPPDASGDGRLADPGSLRRIEAMAAAWAAAAALGYGLAVSWTGALVLTAAAAASIVGFRGLQWIVSALGPSVDQPAGRPEAPDPPGKIGWRLGLRVLVRLALLGAIAAAGLFLLEPDHHPAIVLGFSTLPAALMTEGLWQAMRAFRERGRDHHDGS